MVAADLTEGWLFDTADIHCHRAAGVEAAAPGRVERCAN